MYVDIFRVEVQAILWFYDTDLHEGILIILSMFQSLMNDEIIRMSDEIIRIKISHDIPPNPKAISFS